MYHWTINSSTLITFNNNSIQFFFFYSFNQKLTLAHQQMSSDYEKLKQEDAEKSAKLQDLMLVFNVCCILNIYDLGKKIILIIFKKKT